MTGARFQCFGCLFPLLGFSCPLLSQHLITTSRATAILMPRIFLDQPSEPPTQIPNSPDIPGGKPMSTPVWPGKWTTYNTVPEQQLARVGWTAWSAGFPLRLTSSSVTNPRSRGSAAGGT